jgi:aryl carrier-like protein
MLCGGEALPRDLARQLLGKGAALWNMYGPTETTIWSLVEEVVANPEDQSDKPQAIGKPIDNTRAYILDARLQPVPFGVPGMLYIGGIGLARGYRQLPKLTAEKFLPDPFSHIPGARMYATGDLAQFTNDGSIEYLGRQDFQIKIRGYRIEIGEIEAVLAKHPAVVQNLVVANSLPDGGQRMIAYYVTDAGTPPTTDELRAFLLEQLPDYMVPSIFEPLDVFPLNSNGKIDRKALPEPTGQRPNLSVEFKTPSTDLETQIAAIWQEALQVDRVGIQDNFFDLGGYSMLMVKVHQQLNASLGESLSLVELFQYPTIQELAKRLSAGADMQSAVDTGQQRANARASGENSRAQRRQQRRAHRQQAEVVDTES